MIRTGSPAASVCMKKTLMLAALSALAALPAAAATRPHSSAAKNHAVALKNIMITPTRLKIRHGESVTWTWGDAAIDSPHNVTSYGKLRFRSSPTKRVGTYSVRFARKGTYTYHCTIHGNMMGRIIVH